MWFAGVLNVLAVLLNLFLGATFGFTTLTYVCIAVNVGVAAFCLTLAALTY